ncbi:glycoside hydrolase family 88/105 protein [Geminisphaera colitermitum]|uniref:glycoside hydrolase family 88/105 protein n=1 Tax=Geminisphaera colitermitum TaxID=1148786 RepID=UPI0001965458|nr:glycoside hydrolase family 88 protein [Geminisphaera colitermitum]
MIMTTPATSPEHHTSITNISVDAPVLVFSPAAIAERAFHRHLELHPLSHYTGVLSLQGLVRLAFAVTNPAERTRLLALATTHLTPFLNGDHSFDCNFPNYLCGGNPSAFLWWQGCLPQANTALFESHVEQIMRTAPRDPNGLLCHPIDPHLGRIFIDIAFAITPFLLFCGRALDRDDLIHEAWRQTRGYVERLRNPANGLLHQAINFRGPGHCTQDHWSRGNGWGLLALAELVAHLPEKHACRPDAEAMFVALADACARTQDSDGMWHQDLTDTTSYVETSGAGLILFALGVGVERGLLGEFHRRVFEKGLRSYLAYIALDGSVHNTCRGCLCAGDGSKQAYMERWHELNDRHAFGPVILAYGQAVRLGLTAI